MTKYQYTGPAADYPTLGFSVSGTGAIVDGTMSTPTLAAPPDARWAVYGGGSAESGITRHGSSAGATPTVEPTDGFVLAYSDADNAYVPTDPAGFGGGASDSSVAAFVADDDSDTRAAIAATFVSQVNDPTSDLRAALDALYGTPGPPVPSSSLPTWGPALAAIVGGTATEDARVMAVGDSTTSGDQAPAHAQKVPTSYPAQLVTLFREAGIPAAPGFICPPSSFGTIDDHWQKSSGWLILSPPSQFGLGRNAAYQGNVGDPSLTFDPAGYGPDATLIYDRFDVYFLTLTAGLGSFTATATGGTPTVVSSTGPTGVGRMTISAGSASATNKLVLSGVTDANVFIVGVEPWHSTIRRVRVANVGVGGSETSGWSGVTDPAGLDSRPVVALYDPHVSVVSLGVNDAVAGRSLSTYTANLDTVLGYLDTAGDVVVAPPVPSKSTASSGARMLQAQYATACSTRGDAYVDLVTPFGGNPASDSLMSDDLHPNTAGYAVMAAAVFDALTS